MKRAAVIIPAYNPRPDLASFVRELMALGMHAVVVTYAASAAGNKPVPDALSSLEHCHVLQLEHTGHSRGRALKAGFSYIRDNLPDLSGIVTVDMDQPVTAQDVFTVAQAIETDRNEILLGCFAKNRVVPEPVASRIIRVSFALLAGIRVADPRTGLRGFPVSMLPWLLDHHPDQDGSEPGLLLVARRYGIGIRQVMLEPAQRQPAQRISLAGFMRIYALLIMFSLSSLVSYLFDIGIYALLIGTVFSKSQNDGTAILFSTVAARVFSSLLNFAINKRIVFRDLRSDHTILVRYITLTLLRMFASYAGVYALTTALGADSRIVKIGVDLILFFIGFRVQQNWVFSRQAIG